MIGVEKKKKVGRGGETLLHTLRCILINIMEWSRARGHMCHKIFINLNRLGSSRYKERTLWAQSFVSNNWVKPLVTVDDGIHCSHLCPCVSCHCSETSQSFCLLFSWRVCSIYSKWICCQIQTYQYKNKLFLHDWLFHFLGVARMMYHS